MAISGCFLVRLRIAILSLEHSLQHLVPKVLTHDRGFSFQKISTFTLIKFLIFFFSVSFGTRFAKWFAKESDFLSDTFIYFLQIGFPLAFLPLIFMVLRGKTQDFVIIIENKLTNQL